MPLTHSLLSIQVGVIDSVINGPYPKEELNEALSYHPKNYEYHPLYNKIDLECPKCHGRTSVWTEQIYCPECVSVKLEKVRRWDGRVRMLSLRTNKFPTGLLSKVCDILNDLGYPYKIERHDRPAIEIGLPDMAGIDLRPYQLKAIHAMLHKKRGTVKIPTGGGKTLVAAAVIKALGLHCAYIVHTSTLLKQTLEVFEKIFPGEVGVVQGKHHDWKKVTICMVQTLANIVEAKQTKPFQNYQILIIDEEHHLTSGKSSSWYVAARHFTNAWIRYGLSATPIISKKGMLLIGTTGPIIAQVSMKKLQKSGHISESSIQFYHYQAPWAESSSNWQTVYKENIIHCEQRNDLGCRLAIKHAKQNRLTMIFVDRIEHGMLLFKQLNKDAPTLKINFLSGLDDPVYIDRIKNQAKKKQLDILIVTRKLFGEGVDIPAIDVLINLAGGESVIAFTQMFGRGLRISKGKNALLYIDFMDTTQQWLERHSNSRISHCKKLQQTVTIVNENGDEEVI